MHVISKKLPSFDGETLFVSEYSVSPHPSKTYILLSGLGGCSTSWHWFIDAIALSQPNGKFVAVDLRGHGKSSHKFDKLARNLMDCFAQDLDMLVKNYIQESTEFIFVGHSFGCLIFQEYIQKYGHNPFHKTFFFAGPMQIGKPWLKIPFSCKLLATWSKFKPNAMRQLTLEEHARYKNSSDLNLFRILQDTKIMGKMTYTLIWLSLLGWKADRMEKLNQKNIHRIFGKNDIFLSRGPQQKIQICFPNCSYHYLPANHNLITNIPEAAAEIVAKNT